MNFLTNFGDLAVLLPLSAVMLIWLIGLRPRSSAIWWVVALGLCVGLTALLKIYLYACQPSAELQSPSGHTSLGTLVYGAIAFVVAAEVTGWQRVLALGGGLLVICGIAVSRILLGAHTPLDVVLGALIGSVALAVFARAYLGHKPAAPSLRPLMLALVLLTAVLHGEALHAEEMLHAIGRYLGAVACP
jgi:membrane-associated phospholipid phosphatase